MPSFGEKSNLRLSGVHESLQTWARNVVSFYDCTVLKDGGLRTQDRQNELVASGASKKADSNHLRGTALDLSPYPVIWPNREERPDTYEKDLARFYHFVGFALGIAKAMGLDIRTGADWDGDNDFTDQTFDDLVHFELREV